MEKKRTKLFDNTLPTRWLVDIRCHTVTIELRDAMPSARGCGSIGEVPRAVGRVEKEGLMTPVQGTAVALETLADLLDYLGGIAPERVRLHPAPGTATEDDVLSVHDREGRLCELVDGVLVEKAMGFRESLLAATLIIILGTL
jgi:hypothetical protein